MFRMFQRLITLSERWATDNAYMHLEKSRNTGNQGTSYWSHAAGEPSDFSSTLDVFWKYGAQILTDFYNDWRHY